MTFRDDDARQALDAIGIQQPGQSLVRIIAGTLTEVRRGFPALVERCRNAKFGAYGEIHWLTFRGLPELPPALALQALIDSQLTHLHIQGIDRQAASTLDGLACSMVTAIRDTVTYRELAALMDCEDLLARELRSVQSSMLRAVQDPSRKARLIRDPFRTLGDAMDKLTGWQPEGSSA